MFSGGKACSGGEIVIGVPCAVVYDGTQYNIIGRGVPNKADVAAHATTADIWVAREIVLTGGAVTFTDIADAPYVGAVAWVKQQAANVWTDGAVFAVQGDANYTAAAGDWVRIYATTVSTFEVTIYKANGTPVKTPLTVTRLYNSQVQNTGGGTATVTGWRISTLNTSVGTGMGLGSDQFTPPAGTYNIRATHPFYATTGAQCKLYNVTQTTDVVLGSSQVAPSATAVTVNSVITGHQFTANGTDAYAIYYQVLATSANLGLGAPANIGNEVYLDVWLERVA